MVLFLVVFGRIYCNIQSVTNLNVFQASIALNLSFQAIWAHVSLLGCKYAGKADGSADDLTQDALKDSISSSCAYSSFYLDVLHQCGNESLNEILAESLLNWSSANDLSKSFFSPMVLVKQWVKVCYVLKLIFPLFLCFDGFILSFLNE